MLAPAVRALLGSLRRRIRQYVWLQGCAAALAWLGAAFWATLAIDWFFEPSPAVRGVMLIAVAAVFGAVIFWLIVRRAFVPITDGNAATVLERRFPWFGDSLLTAVALGDRTTDPAEVDPRMLAETCREAADRVAEVDLRKVFNPRPLWLHGSAALLLTLSVAFFAILFPGAFEIWVSRALALSPERWPRQTRLEVVGFPRGEQKVARGSDLEVVARADATMPRVPRTVEVRYRTDGGGRGRATMDRRGVARGSEEPFQEYAYAFRSVLADIRFDLVGGDDRVDDLWIHVVDSPVIARMTLRCELPAYIGRKQPPMSVTGVMQIPMGSRVTVHADQSNKDLIGVQVSRVVEAQPQSPEMLDPRNFSADRRGFLHALGPLTEDTTLLFTLTDTDGIQSREPMRLVLTPTPDQTPRMAVQLDGIGTAITPEARIPVAGRIDDDYGIDRVWFEHTIDQQKPANHRIAELPRHPSTFRLNRVALEASELELKPGQKLLISVKAADLRDLGDGPNVAGSERWLLEVVTSEQMRTLLESRELVLRKRFERIVQEVTETRDLLARLVFEQEKPKNNVDETDLPNTHGDKEPGEAEFKDSHERRRSLRLLRVRGALSNSRKSAAEVLGVAEAFDDIRKQLVNNRLDTAELKDRLQGGIAEPLHGIAKKMFPELEHRLESLQAALNNARQGPLLRDDAQHQADEILLAMQKVLDRMLELENFNEAVELLRNIIEMQEKLHEQTQQRHKQKIRDLLKE